MSNDHRAGNDYRATWQWTLTALASAVLVACGGGGGSTPSETSASVVSGAIVKGPVGGASVCAYVLQPSGKGTPLGCTTSSPDGSYSISINYTGEIVIEATGGTYLDEATGVAGVVLSAPLTVAGTASPAGQRLYATPLTAMAFNQAVAGGGLTVAGFETLASQIGSAFGVPSSMPLASTQPVVTGMTNAYGDALIAVSGIISSSLTLDNFVNSKPIGAPLGNSCSPSIKVAQTEQPAGVYLVDDGSAASQGLAFDVTDPVPAWRALLPTAGPAMGCDVTVNTVSSVSLSCPLAAIQAGLRFAQDAMIDPVPASLPAQGVLVAGRRIDGRGNLQLSGVPITFPGASTGSGAITPPLTINLGSGSVITKGTDINVVGGTISSGVGAVVTTVPISMPAVGGIAAAGSISIRPSNCKAG